MINVSRLEHIPDFEQLKELVESEEFVLVGITGARSEEMKTAAKAVGLAVMASGKSRKSEPEPEPAPRQPLLWWFPSPNPPLDPEQGTCGTGSFRPADLRSRHLAGGTGVRQSGS